MSKFKNTEELEKAYKELEKEFTKKSQKLAEVEKTNYVTLLHNEMDSLLNDYAKRRISDLEAKLAESEERINWLVEQVFNRKWAKKYVEMRRKEDQMLCLPDSDEVYEKYFELKQQLAEKDEEIKEWIAVRDDKNKVINKQTDKINKLKEELKAKETLNQIFKDNREDKISFAVKKLKEIQIYVDNQHFMNARYKCEKKVYADIWNFIDNQIKELKEWK